MKHTHIYHLDALLKKPISHCIDIHELNQHLLRIASPFQAVVLAAWLASFHICNPCTYHLGTLTNWKGMQTLIQDVDVCVGERLPSR